MTNFWIRITFFTVFIAYSSSIQPVIIEEPKDVTVLQGADVTLRCVVEYLPASDLTPVQWTRGDFALGYDRNLSDWERYSMVGDFSIGEYNLHIENVNAMEDENQYECQVTEHLLRTKKATLTILVPPTGPYVEGKQSNKVTKVDVVIGKQNEIVCQAVGGKPAANLHWYRNGIEIFDEVSTAVTGPESMLHNTSSTLRITPAESDGAATYACVMTSDALTADQFGRKLIKLNMLKPPIVSVTLPSTIEDGDYVTAECRAVADPPVISYRWYVNGREQTGEISATFGLGVVNKTWHDKTIACEAKNDGGFSERNAANIDVLYPPVLIGGSSTVTAEIGENVTLWCEWDSNPKPSVHWIREGDPSFVWTLSTLQLPYIDQYDAGKYVCHASAGNIGGNQASSELIVRGPPIFEDQKTQYALLDQDAVIQCSLWSRPGITKVTWTWTHGGIDFSLFGNQSRSSTGLISKAEAETKYQGYFIVDAQSAQMRIRGVTTEDLHSYICSVSNMYGEESLVIMLEEDTSHAEGLAAIGIIVGGAMGGLLVLILFILLACFCLRSQRQRKSTHFDKEQQRDKHSPNLMEKNGEKVYDKEEVVPINQVHDIDGRDEYNVRSSLSSRGDAPASTVSGSEDTNPTPISGHDDGYHTEGANSWNRGEQSGQTSAGFTSPTKPGFPAGQFVKLPPRMDALEHGKPLFSGRYPSTDVYIDDPPRPMSVNRFPYHQSTYDPTNLTQPKTTIRSASALAEPMSPLSIRYIHRNYSDITQSPGSQRYQDPNDYYLPTSQSYLPATSRTDQMFQHDSPSFLQHSSIPTNRGPDRYVQMPVGSSHSSLDKLDRESISASAVAARAIDHPETAAGRDMSSRLSQSSRSSEFTRPMVARMATHV